MSPRKPGVEGKRSVQLNFRVLPEEKAAFEQAADEAGLELSMWLRMVARKAAGLKVAV